MTLANWRDLSIVFLVIEAFIMSLVPGVILFLCIQAWYGCNANCATITSRPALLPHGRIAH